MSRFKEEIENILDCIEQTDNQDYLIGALVTFEWASKLRADSPSEFWKERFSKRSDANAHILADLLMECETAYRLWKRHFPNDISLDRFIEKARVVLSPKL